MTTNSNQSHEDNEEEVEPDSLITTIPPYYIPPYTHNAEEFNFEDFECG